MTIPADWRNQLTEKNRKEIDWAVIYARDFNHGATGHNMLLLIAQLADLLDIYAGNIEPPPPPDPDALRLTFGKYNGSTLPEIYRIDRGYVEWLAREARDEMIRRAAQHLIAQTPNEPPADTDELPF